MSHNKNNSWRLIAILGIFLFLAPFLLQLDSSAYSYQLGEESLEQVPLAGVIFNYASVYEPSRMFTGVATNDTLNHLYLAGSGSISVRDSQDGSLIKDGIAIPISFPTAPIGLSFNDFSNTLFAFTDNTIIKIHPDTFEILATIVCTCSSVTDIVFGQDGRMFVSMPDGIVVMDANGLILGRVDLPENPYHGYKLDIAYAKNLLYALPLESENARLYKFDITDNTPSEVAVFTPGIYNPSFNLSSDGNRVLIFGFNLQTGKGILKQFNSATFELNWAIEGVHTFSNADTNSDGRITFATSTRPNYPGVIYAIDSNTGRIFAGESVGSTVFLDSFGDNDIALVEVYRVNLYKLLGNQTFQPMVVNNFCPGPITDDFSNINSGWPTSSSASGSFGYLNGEYAINHVNSDQWTAVTRGDEWVIGTEIVEIEGYERDGDSALWGLIFGLNNNWTEFYTFEIIPETQSWFIFRYQAGSGWSSIASGSSPAINMGSVPNTLRISGVKYFPLTFMINGVDIYGLGSISEPTGRVGITGASFTANVNLRYDNYVIAQENCSIPARMPSEESHLNLSHIVLDRPSLDQIPKAENLEGD